MAIILGRGYMKKFSNFVICLLLCVFAIGFVGCGKDKGNGFSPATEETVIGNGGMVVRKGEYVYFANGFQNVSELKEDQRDSAYTKGGLYVAKLENDEFVRDKDGYLVSDNLRQVSTKLAGYDATDLYVFGDYLYFVSPSTKQESGKLNESKWAKDRSVFYRVKLNNFDKIEELYQANVKHENLSYQYYNKNGKTYLLVHEKGEDLNGDKNTDRLLRIDVQAKKKKNKVKVVASNVTSFVFGANKEDNAFDRVYFVEKADEKYNLYRYDVTTNEKTTVIDGSTTEIVAKFVSENYVFITRTDGSTTRMQRAEIGGSFRNMMPDASEDAVGKLFLMPNGSDLMSVVNNRFQFYMAGNQTVSPRYIEDTDSDSVSTINVIGFANGSIVYYDNNNKLKMVSYSEFLAGNTSTIHYLAKVEVNADYLDINGGDLYYCTGEKAGYLFKIDLVNNTAEEGKAEGEIVGVYLDADKPKDEENAN